MAKTDEGNSNIQVEITDAHAFHCFRLLLNPKGHEPCCPAAMAPDAPCGCRAEGNGVRIEVMFHARSLVDLIHKCSLALCDWQAQTSGYLMERLGGLICTRRPGHDGPCNGYPSSTCKPGSPAEGGAQ